MFVLSFPLGRWLQNLSGGRRYNTWLIIGMVVVSVYVGYFGAGGASSPWPSSASAASTTSMR